MPYCSTHGFQQGKHCSDCGAPLSETPSPATDDSVRVRSPESHAHASANPTFVLPGGHVEARPALVKCPKCGKRNLEPATFDCQGECSRENLCERHFDEEYEVCVDCARTLRGEAKAEAERQAQLHADLATWCQRAEQVEAQVVELTRQGQQASKDLDQARADQRLAQERVRNLEQDLAALRRRAEQAEASVTTLTQRSKQADNAQARAEGLEKDLTSWRRRAQQAESQLAAIDRARQEPEAQKQRESATARCRAEEAEKQNTVWQQIGIELVRIPAGEFLYGEDKRKVYLPDYWIAKTPVTNVQYKAFVDATRCQPPGHWTNGQIPAGKEKHPVVKVSWDDVQTFCRWAGLCIPTEQEWEKTARGTDGREYPWGNADPDKGLCNFSSNVKDTTPVDRYPAGVSPYGLLDMTGNVWEWCEDWYDGERKYRVVRGGSWDDEARTVRAVYRYRVAPDRRFGYLGFRPAR